MTPFTIRHGIRHVAMGLCWLPILGSLGCGSASATARGPAPPAQAAASEGTTAETAIELIADRALWPLDADAARALLQRLGPVTNTQPTPGELSIEAGPSGVVRHAEVSYARDEQERWVFDAAGFLFGGDDLKRLHHQLEVLLIQHLGEPEWTQGAGGEELTSAGWALAEPLTLLFAPSPDAENLLMISISEPQGEADE
jgi:hypothetical protein